MTQVPWWERSRWPRRVGTLLLVAACWLLGGLFFGANAELKYPEEVPDAEVGWVAIDFLLGQLACLLVFAMRSRRRRLAGIAALVAVACQTLSLWAGIVAMYGIVTVSSWRSRRWLVAVDVVALASGLGYLALVPGEGLTWPVGLATVVALVAMNLLGLYLGQRRALHASYRAQAEMGEREQSARTAQALAEERTRIAREMHDTLSHRLSVISLHAGALSTRPDRAAAQVQQAATTIQQTAQEASEELRALLAVLRDDPADRSSTVTLQALDEIIAEARAVGVRVTSHVDDGLRGRLPRLAEQRSAALAAALREGLANALKHAPGQPVEVRLAERDRGVLVAVANPLGQGSALAGGYGLVGLRERLTLAQGTLRQDIGRDHHRLEAWVPWEATR